MFVSELWVESYRLGFVLRGNRTAAKQIARARTRSVPRDPFPEHVQHGGIPIFGMHARSSELKHFRANPFKGSEIEKLLAVISEISFCAETALHPVSPDQLARAGIADHQMVADEITAVAIETDPC